MDGAHRREGGELDIRLLGPLDVWRQGRAVAIGGPKPRALLAALALDAGRVVSVDRLLENLWPGEPPETAAHAVQVYVSQLRKALGGSTIATRPPGYVLELDPARVDAHRFAQLVNNGRETLGAGDPAGASSLLREALALWRGPALADFTYEPFAQTEIARLEELRVVALEERIEADLALGRHHEVATELEALVEAHPLRERPRGQLMLALYRAGRQADALAAFRAGRETMVDELGIEPGPELRALEVAVLRQDETLLPPEGPAAPVMQFRRLVTILFVDLVDSLALAGSLDAEALGRVLSGYFETVSAVVAHHGGTVEKYTGDAVMAVFGVPATHEDDALRAARAALDIRTAVGNLSERLVETHGVGLEIRIGVEAGEVVTTPTEPRQRLVAGETVGIASRLEQAAGADEIVVGELAARLIDHAAHLEPLGELQIKGKRAPVHAFRLLELEAAAPAFGGRLDAALVGRKSELAALRKVLKRAVDGDRAQVAVVVGPPGVGKTRVAVELARRSRGTTTLFGRCLSYGEGITYWPLREVAQQAPASDECDAFLAALEADPPPPAPEIAWRFRTFCEALSRERPLLLVFDDLHWAEATFLELLEHVAVKGSGPVFVVAVAREELLEERPAFIEGRDNSERIVLDPLSAADTEALLDGLGGQILETDQRRRIVETAEGNPLFLEQLLALALEGGLAEHSLPATIQSLLAARLDRLGPGERAVLERGAVVGKEFAAEDVVSLLEPDAAPTAEAHLRTLSDRGFIRPRGDSAFSFRHVLVQEAVYRAAPKRLRAELHERFADRLDTTAPDLPELDEFVGYHLERAYRLRVELGESDRRTRRLAEDGGRRLGDAGTRAWRRNDEFATVNLLARATSLLDHRDVSRRDLLCELAIGHLALGNAEEAERVVEAALADSRAASDHRRELRARLELAFIRLVREPSSSREELLSIADDAIPLFERADDHRAAGRAWLLVGYVRGVLECLHAERLSAAERALDAYRAAALQTSACLGEVAASLYHGPTPVADAIARCELLLRDPHAGRLGQANVSVYQGGLEAQRGRFAIARELVREAQTTYEDFGQLGAVSSRCRAVLADLELLAGDLEAAEAVLRTACEDLERSGDLHSLWSRAAELAETLVLQGRLGEASHWIELSSEHDPRVALPAVVRSLGVRARVAAIESDPESAWSLAMQAVTLASKTDAANLRARSLATLAWVSRAVGRASESVDAAERATQLFREKGNVVGLEQIRELTASPIGA
jgi:DNA-binding SARP family transcriptional activator/predicted ATPase